MSAVFQLLRDRRNFRRLWMGTLVSQLGDWIGWVAVAMVAIDSGGGAVDIALVFVAHHLPAALLTPVSGVVADRVDRRLLLCSASVVLGFVTVGMAVAAFAGAVAVLQLLLLVRSGAVAFVTPAERAALPRLVKKEELLLAGALDSASWSVMFALGMAAGGVLSTLGPTLALVIDAATFLVATVFFMRLPRLEPLREASARRPSLLRGLPDAVAEVWPRREQRRAVFAKTPMSVVSGAGWIALALHVDTAGGAILGGLGFGVLHAVRGIGTGIGPVFVARWAASEADRLALWRGAVWLGMAGATVLGFAGSPLVLVFAALVWGAGGGTNWVVSNEQFQRRTADRILARVSALDHVGSTVGMTLGVLGVALAFEAGATLGVAVLVAVVPAAAAWWWLDRTAVRASAAAVPAGAPAALLGRHC